MRLVDLLEGEVVPFPNKRQSSTSKLSNHEAERRNKNVDVSQQFVHRFKSIIKELQAESKQFATPMTPYWFTYYRDGDLWQNHATSLVTDLSPVNKDLNRRLAAINAIFANPKIRSFYSKYINKLTELKFWLEDNYQYEPELAKDEDDLIQIEWMDDQHKFISSVIKQLKQQKNILDHWFKDDINTAIGLAKMMDEKGS